MNFARILCLCAVAGFISTSALADDPPSAVGPLMKLFQSGRLPAERQGAVVEMICNRGNEHDLRVVFDKLVQPEGLPADVRAKALGWLTDAAVTRKVKPAGELGGLEQLVVGPAAAKDPALQRGALKLAAVWKDTQITPALQKLALDADTKADLRRAAIEGLITIADPRAQQTLLQLANQGSTPAIRMQAVAGLAGFNTEEAAKSAAQILQLAEASDEPGAMLDAFFARKDGSDRLAAEIEKHPPQADVAKVALRYMYSVGRSDPALSGVLSKIAGIAADPPPPTPEEVGKLVDDVIAKGNAERGERIFRRKDLSCMKCHSVSRAGGQVGPELSAVGGSSPVDYIVNSILNPNLAVKEQYVTRVFALDSGKVVTGVVLDRDDVRVNVRDSTGATITIPTADIEEEAEGKSLMPQGLTKFLTRDELLDLAKFISDLGKPGPYAVYQGKTLQRWRMLTQPPTELTAEVPHLEHFRQHVLGAERTAWVPVYAMVGGNLPLDELRSGQEPSVL
ncbi:MAG TPA: HEAT repeat domain-containing protein, partial [Planctomycetaceae bacterium]|nr:HEAT repeat domain-containing protein [Planctomycetaceae bacterium]